ncbi:MAG: hypothetical protein PHT19_16310 [Methylococcus sp.]|nr:hypothetical protein [Methylococcus sp.]
MRLTRLTLALAAVFASAGTYALGVGDLRLQSALNQTLKAEVPLVVSGEKPDDIKISLGSAEAFAQAGIERNEALSSLRFQLSPRPDGRYAIEISSREPIREPFLSFLIEVNWPDGRIVKEFTVLVDPPAPVLPALAPPQPASPPSAYRRAFASPYAPGGEPPVYRPRSEPAQLLSEYGPVRRRDTLSSIARQVNPDGDLSAEQIKVGIYRANPDAFIGGSVNALKHGATLSIPPRAELAALGPAEAAREWRALKTAARAQQSARSEEAGAAQEPPPPASAPSETVREGQGSKLKLLAPGQKAQAGKAGDLALEVAESVRQENEEIRARLGNMEQQLAALQKLLELKDQQIAALQAVPPQAGQGAAASPLPGVATVQSSAPPVPARATPESAAVAPPHIPEQPPAAVQTPSAAPPAEAEAEDGGWLWGIGFGAVSLAAALAWWANRRRKQVAFHIGLPPGLEALMHGKKEPVPAKAVPTAGARSLDAYNNSAKAVDSGEPIDPIAEADAFIKNAKLIQAEQLIRAAITAHPERDEFYLKLLEILYLGEKFEAFEELAEDVSGWRQARPDLWREVSHLSLKFRLKRPAPPEPESPIPAAPVPTAETVDVAPEPVAETEPRFVLDESPKEAPAEEAVALPLDTAQNPEPEPEPEPDVFAVEPEAPAPAIEDMAPLEFDLSGLDFKAPAEQGAKAPEIVHDAGNLIAYDAAPAPVPAQLEPADDETLESLLAEFETLGASGEQAPKAAELPLAPEEFPLTIEIEAVPVAEEVARNAAAPLAVQARPPEDADPYAEISGMDPLETKLDLSKAYVDMGDAEAARELLEEVLNTGNARQKTEARVLMDRIKPPQGP